MSLRRRKKIRYEKILAALSFSMISFFLFFSASFQTETALVYDAVQMFAKALTDLDRSQEVETTSIDCGGRETWQHGNSLVNYMKMV